ncbi:uncharacterized protein LOC120453434 [Drosophila santomea]|uniref:uncharacterized protein LOC120453434 n=1 Tax=Drosophila santomea TaxID=129105 RepID=UPI00195407B7|nr:uncharacterized protein LOC120453434 [Drosophila santomea]
MGAWPGQPCFGAQLKRNQSQKSARDMGNPRSPSCDGLTHLPGQHLCGDKPSWQGLLLAGQRLSYKSSIINAKCGLALHTIDGLRCEIPI